MHSIKIYGQLNGDLVCGYKKKLDTFCKKYYILFRNYKKYFIAYILLGHKKKIFR